MLGASVHRSSGTAATLSGRIGVGAIGVLPQRDQRVLQRAEMLKRAGDRYIGRVDRRGVDLAQQFIGNDLQFLTSNAATPGPLQLGGFRSVTKEIRSKRMPLKVRPTGLGFGTYKDNVDYSVFSGEWLIGRIYERNGFPDEVLALC